MPTTLWSVYCHPPYPLRLHNPNKQQLFRLQAVSHNYYNTLSYNALLFNNILYTMNDQDMPNKKGVRAVMIGGGTGSFTILSELKNHVQNLTSVVNMVDDGGSTGVLRDELGVLPPGDIRQCLVALSSCPEIWRELFSYRYPNGPFVGHAFGNIFLSTLEKITGSFVRAVSVAEQLLNTVGHVLPVTLDDVRLCLQLPDKHIIRGEHTITGSFFNQEKDYRLFLEPHAQLNPALAQVIQNADIIIVGPGNLFSSIIPTLLVDGFGDMLRASKAKKVYICNLVTKPGQTDGFKVHDFVNKIGEYIGQDWCDFVLYNTERPPKELLEKYAKEGEQWVEYHEDTQKQMRYTALGMKLIAQKIHTPSLSDPLINQRTLIRHDAEKVSRAIMRVHYFDEE